MMNNDEEEVKAQVERNIRAHGERMAAINLAAYSQAKRMQNMEADLEMLDLCFGKYLKPPKEETKKMLKIEKILLGAIAVAGVLAVLSMAYCNHQLEEMKRNYQADFAIMQEEAARREYNLRDLLPDYQPPKED